MDGFYFFRIIIWENKTKVCWLLLFSLAQSSAEYDWSHILISLSAETIWFITYIKNLQEKKVGSIFVKIEMSAVYSRHRYGNVYNLSGGVSRVCAWC